MRKNLLLLLGLGVFLSFTVHPLAAQDEKKTTVKIVIEEGDEVTVDTTFELKEGQDPEMIKKIVSHLAGEDIHMKISKGDSRSSYACVHADDGVIWHAKPCEGFKYHIDEMGIDLDSLKEAHGGKKVIVMKDDKGDITIKKQGEGEDCEEIHLEHLHEGDHHMVIVTEDGDEEGETKVIVKSMGEHEDDCEGKEENVDVYVIKKGDKDVKVVKKKVKVEIEEE